MCGSLAIASWTSSKFAIRMLALRARPIKSALEQGSTAIHISFRFVDTSRSDREDTIIDNFLGSGVKVAKDTLTGVGGENGDFNPSFREFRKVIGSRKSLV